MQEWTQRTEMLLGEGGLERLRNATVAVAGCGGVGAYAAEMLVRAGVGNLLIIDNDVVSVSNRNRQLLALSSTTGRPKCEVLRDRLLDINPELQVVAIQKYIMSDGAQYADSESQEIGALLAGRSVDYMVDAIDTLSPKITLIKYCLDNAIPLVSSMGAGAKVDATAVRLEDISKTVQCPLAHMLRKRLHKMGIFSGFLAVFSPEIPMKQSVVLEESRNKKSQVGTVSYMPAVFGCVCAQAVICHLAEIQ